MNMVPALLVFAGGGVGSLLRFGASVWLNTSPLFPAGTFLANLVASFLAGYFSGLENRQHALLLLTGVCGGFSTFSTFSLENLKLIQQGDMLWALLYSVASLSASLLCVWAGMTLSSLSVNK